MLQMPSNFNIVQKPKTVGHGVCLTPCTLPVVADTLGFIYDVESEAQGTVRNVSSLFLILAPRLTLQIYYIDFADFPNAN